MERKLVRRRATALAEPEAEAEALAAKPTPRVAEYAASEPAAETTADAVGGGAAVAVHDEVCRVGYAPIVRVDAPRREIELCATSEAIDSYGTVFDYEASKAAFGRWLGNVREMHERRAVGRRVAVRCDDEARRVYVRVRISEGAADTWAKIADGTLRGASIGASNVVWRRQVRRAGGHERAVQVATAYDLVELSLVDNPSNPDTLGITIVRAAEPDTLLLAELEEDGAPPAETSALYQPPLPGMEALPLAQPREQADAAVEMPQAMQDDGGTEGSGPWATSGVRSTSLRRAKQEQREHAAGAGDGEARKEAVGADSTDARNIGERAIGVRSMPARSGEGAPGGGEQQRALGPFSAEPAGYPDAGVPARAEARPTEGQPVEGNARERFHAAARGILVGCGCGQCEAALAALGTPDEASADAERGSAPDNARLREAALARAMAAGLGANTRSVERVEAGVRALGEAVRAASGTMEGALGELRARVERIEAQPLPGGPALHAVAVEKPSPLAPAMSPHRPVSPAEQFRALESLAGRLSDPQAQIAVAAELIRLRQQEGGR